MPRPDTMKAMILPEFGAPLRLATVPVPKIGPTDVLLRVRATGVALPARNIVAIPQSVSDVDAAIAADAIATPYHACREEARVGPGDLVLIVGAGGGVGIHAVQMAKLAGGWVLAADITDDKLAAAKDS